MRKKDRHREILYRGIAIMLIASLLFASGYVTGGKAEAKCPEGSLTYRMGKKKDASREDNKSEKDKINLVSVNPITGSLIRIRLNKKTSLKKSDIVVKTKSQEKGSYNKKMKIHKLDKVNQKTYDIELTYENDSRLDNVLAIGDYVLVKIAKLNGRQKKEVRFTNPVDPSVSYETGLVGKKFSTTVDFSDWVTGYCKYKVTGLPVGLKVKKGENYVEITGKPKKVQSGKVVRIIATDENGKKVRRRLYPIIGSAKKIVTMAEKQRNHVLSGDGKEETLLYYTSGGSGQYQVSIKRGASVIKPANEVAHQGEEEYFIISDKLKIGKYKFTYEVQDSKKMSLKARASAVFESEKPVKITGRVLAKDGKGVNDTYVLYTFKDKKNQYSTFYYEVEATKSNGSYTLYVAPSKIYEVYLERGEESYTDVRFAVGRKNCKKRHRLNLYRIKLKSKDGDDLSQMSWYQEDGTDTVGTGKELLLSKGKYNLTADMTWLIYSASFTANKNKTVYVTKKDLVVGTLAIPGITNNVTISNKTDTGEVSAYKFTPPADGKYRITVNNIGDYSLGVVFAETDPTTPINGTSDADWIFQKTMSVIVDVKKDTNYYLCLLTTTANVSSTVIIAEVTE